MSDYLLKVISKSGSIKGYAAVTTNLVSEACSRHQTKSLSTVMLGRALTGAALLGGTVKQDQRISLRFEGNGPVGRVTTESTADGKLRGNCKNSDIDFSDDEDPLIQIRKSIGSAGILTVTKDLGLKSPYSGTVHMVTGEIGEDIAYYLMESEQIPSAVSVGATPSYSGSAVDVAGGFLIQTIPTNGGAEASDEANIESIAEMIQGLDSITVMLSKGYTPEDILKEIFKEVPFKVLERIDLEYKCTCNKSVISKALITIGSDELLSLSTDKDGISVSCEFCNQKYQFSSDELTTLASL